MSKTVNLVFKDVIRRRNKQALNLVPKELQDSFVEHWAKWSHDNVPAPEQTIDKEWVMKKYNISTKPVPANASHVKFASPFGNAEEGRMNALIKYEKELQRVFKFVDNGKFLLDVHPTFTNRKFSVWAYSALFLLVPIGIFVLIFNQNPLYKSLFEGSIWAQKKTDKKAWDSVEIETVFDSHSNLTVKRV
ncbi:predicted protein [Naegleria gruberi]|uniref:Predicted protein n=1 Tax=Naegleria gruberi TaxID=5762 RepID=D2VZB0_NAEGR|nr:uncharacterized protein NAEGRDRAFT_81806 [Naegleria gruberi]EFC37760.1 predicted protein [Naegleria gruberi]|eukprot:XP_002670504.1 predicted protein [Naegleria gruberi strain NEG-M]